MLVNLRDIRTFFFADDEFIGPGRKGKDRAYEIAREIMRRGLKVTFTFSARVNGIDEELFIELKKAGLTSVFIGVESGVSPMLKYLNKGITAEQSIEAMRTLDRIGIEYAAGSILIGPYTTLDDIRDSIDFWEKAMGYNMRCFNCLTLYEGTKLSNALDAQGVVDKERFTYSYDSIMDPKVRIYRDVIDGYMEGFFTKSLLEFKKVAVKMKEYMTRSGTDMQEMNKRLYQLRDIMFYKSFTDVSLKVLDYLKRNDIEDDDRHMREIDQLMMPERMKITGYLTEADNLLKSCGRMAADMLPASAG